MSYKLNIGNEELLRFESLIEIKNWVQKEKEYWSILEEPKPKKGGSLTVALDHFPSDFDDFLIGLLQMRTILETEDLANGIIEQLQSKLNNSSYIAFHSDMGQFIAEECRVNRRFARKILWLATHPTLDSFPDDFEIHFAMAALSDFKRGNVKQTLTASIRNSDELAVTYTNFIKDENSQSQTRIKEFEELLDHQKDDFRKEIEAIKEFYEQNVSLQKPIHYWNKKSSRHAWATFGFALVFIGYTLVALSHLIEFVNGYQGGPQGFITSWKDSGFGGVATFAGMIGIGMVIARVIYRMFASQLHLYNDANERVVMIQTYLSLAQKGHAKEEFLGALLQRLFSPSSDGIVKSDLGSVGPLDTIVKQLGNK